jgi:hypothetical protein
MLQPSSSSLRYLHFASILTPLLLGVSLTAQAPRKPSAPHPNESSDPILRAFEFRSIGPAVMMGRLDDIQGSDKDPMIMYIGFATGDLWKSTDGGNPWHSQFDNMENESIGAIGIAPSDPNIVYVGTGEANNRQSSSIGNSMWATTDGGKAWTHLGREKTQSNQSRRGRSEESQDRLRGLTRPSVRSERGARSVSFDRRREKVEEPEIHRSQYRLQ